jgi:multicomponent Na+:H+ antiporter subunit C
VEIALALVAGALFAAGVHLMLGRSAVKMVIGLVLMSHAANLLVFTMGGLTRGRPPIVLEGAGGAAAPFANPLPQALILTAIVIGFGLQAFSLALVYRATREAGTDDVDAMTSSEEPAGARPPRGGEGP